MRQGAISTPPPSLHKDIDLGVPTGPLHFYLRGKYDSGIIAKPISTVLPSHYSNPDGEWL
jgi:hypothetical protein